MLLTIVDAGLLALQGTFPDTIVTVNAEPPGGAFERVASIASGLMSIALLILTVFLVPAAWNFRKSYKRINQLLDRVYADINPIVKHANTISDNVDYITTSIRVDIQQVNRTIAEANRRMMEALELSERRLHDFNALIEVVQREAEGAFVTTASTLRGVRAGTAAFQHGMLGEADDLDGDDLDSDPEEDGDGDHDAESSAPRRAEPRIKPR
ncbi:MAG TPA: DUF948 domain-containing protein [Gemmatimonadaceae bacterium]|nr:DUF948 domain-containing protein [Gemmatimonadaceae bacterium]